MSNNNQKDQLQLGDHQTTAEEIAEVKVTEAVNNNNTQNQENGNIDDDNNQTEQIQEEKISNKQEGADREEEDEASPQRSAANRNFVKKTQKIIQLFENIKVAALSALDLQDVDDQKSLFYQIRKAKKTIARLEDEFIKEKPEEKELISEIKKDLRKGKTPTNKELVPVPSAPVIAKHLTLGFENLPKLESPSKQIIESSTHLLDPEQQTQTLTERKVVSSPISDKNESLVRHFNKIINLKDKKIQLQEEKIHKLETELAKLKLSEVIQAKELKKLQSEKVNLEETGEELTKEHEKLKEWCSQLQLASRHQSSVEREIQGENGQNSARTGQSVKAKILAAAVNQDTPVGFSLQGGTEFVGFTPKKKAPALTSSRSTGVLGRFLPHIPPVQEQLAVIEDGLDLKWNISLQADELQDSVIGPNRNTLVCFKDQKNYLIGTHLGGLKVIKDGEVCFSEKLREETNEFFGGVYSDLDNAYYLNCNNKLYRKAVDGSKPELIMDLRCKGNGAVPAYSRMHKKLVLVKNGGQVVVFNQATLEEEIVVSREGKKDKIMALSLVEGFAGLQVFALTFKGILIAFDINLHTKTAEVVGEYQINLDEVKGEYVASFCLDADSDHICVAVSDYNWYSSKFLLLKFKGNESAGDRERAKGEQKGTQGADGDLLRKVSESEEASRVYEDEAEIGADNYRAGAFELVSELNMFLEGLIECLVVHPLGFSQGRVLFFALTWSEEGELLTLSYSPEDQQFVEEKHLRVKHQASCPCFIQKIEEAYYYAGWTGKIFKLELL